ncbi:hypothetical protein ACH5RR_003183 [Cinchona calisaya]|uniref:Uncharacterized protein n=1 Tax=Cinchona calisaya TaxID=153742 RepID=A0ABD3AU35_9GENT
MGWKTLLPRMLRNQYTLMNTKNSKESSPIEKNPNAKKAPPQDHSVKKSLHLLTDTEVQTHLPIKEANLSSTRSNLASGPSLDLGGQSTHKMPEFDGLVPAAMVSI